MHRDFFANTALLFNTETGKKAYKFIFAVQSPQQVWLSPLEEEARGPAVIVGPDNWEELTREHHSHRFIVDFRQLVNFSDLPQVGTGSIEVVPGVQYVGGQRVVSDSDTVSWDAFAKSLPPRVTRTRTSESSGKKATPEFKAELLAKHPWMAGHMSSKAQVEGGSGAKQERHAPEAQATEHYDLDDDAMEAMFAELDERRRLWEAEAPTLPNDFITTLSGSVWVQRTFGVPYNSFLGTARGGKAKEWCRLYTLPLSNRFDVGLYGEPDASLLSTIWCKAMQYYFDLYVDSNLEVYVYIESDFQGLPEPLEFTALMARASGRKLQRALTLKALAPTNL
jgi:hypothetical protein